MTPFSSSSSERAYGLLAAALPALLLVAACGEDKDQQEACAANEERNPISGECELAVRGTGDAGTTDATGNSDGDQSDSSEWTPPEDASEDAYSGCLPKPNRPDIDTDGDGLEDGCECFDARTDPEKADTDGDGLEDGEELGGDCSFDPGQGDTNPLEPDTDLDGLDDGAEKEAGTDPLDPDSDDDGIEDGVEADTCTDPLESDTDGDGIPDGTEDDNGDGKIGVCSDRNYDPECANGESNPCDDDTDGDDTKDGDEAQYRKCLPKDTENLEEPKIIESAASDGNYKLATQNDVTAAEVSVDSGSVDAHVFEDPDDHYTGFVANFDPGGTTNPRTLADDTASKIGSVFSSAARDSTGRKVTTHDNHEAVVQSVVDIPNDASPKPKPDVARDEILAELVGVSASDLDHSLSTSFDADDNKSTLFVYEVVSRASDEAVVVGALVTVPNYEDTSKSTGYEVDDLTGGTALAKASGELKAECVSFEVDNKPKVDIVISLDGSGSMSEEQKQLSNFATEFTNLLEQANLDWRVGVTSVACDDANNESALSPTFKRLLPSNASSYDCTDPFSGINILPGTSGTTNGELVGGDFTTDASEISSRLDNVNDTNSEFTLTMGAAALDRAMPRDGGPKKFRENASVILITVTDEMDEFYKKDLNQFATKKTLSSSEQQQVQNVTQPWVDYLRRGSLSATVFGLYRPPGEDCNTRAQVAHGIADVVKRTGGNGGSVCQPNITDTFREIANAAAGLSSGLRLLGVPVAPSLEIKHVKLAGGAESIEEMPRSREDGFGYDSIVNRLSFNGPNPPQTNDRLIVPYLRWKGSIKECTKEKDACPGKQICVSGVCR